MLAPWVLFVGSSATLLVAMRIRVKVRRRFGRFSLEEYPAIRLSEQTKARRCLVVRSAEECERIIRPMVQRETVIGFDSEWKPGGSRKLGSRVKCQKEPGPTSVVQLAPLETSDIVVVIQVLLCVKDNDGVFPAVLSELFESGLILKVGFAVDSDVRKLRKDYGVQCNNVLELKAFAGFHKHGVSLVQLCDHFLGARLEKSKHVTLSDWQSTHLTREQVEYAALDAVAVTEIYHHLSSSGKKSHDSAIVASPVDEKRDRDATKGKTSKQQEIADVSMQHACAARQQKLKRERFKAYAKYASLKRDLYENVELQAPDGVPLSLIPFKKMRWYLNKSLAVESDPINPDAVSAIRLVFEPAGRVGAGQGYYVEVKKNRCVRCASPDQLQRHYVVPYAFRRLLPPEFKNHSSHDIVLLCPDCSLVANAACDRLKKRLAFELLGPEEAARALRTSKYDIDVACSRAKKAAKALLSENAHKIPELRKQELQKFVIKVDPSLASALQGSCPQVRVQALLTVMTWDERTLIEDYNTVEAKILHIALHGVTDAESPRHYDVDILTPAVFLFVRQWRENFINCCNPKYLPQAWAVDHRVKTTLSRVVLHEAAGVQPWDKHLTL